ncbi:MAG: insulinase family protein, partial [Bacteroidales bacterium]|nr:insulinase family protein [Bacteroidales bacterium]
MKCLKNSLIALFLILSTLLWCNNIFAQDVEKLPDDPRVKRGSLANGLSYILIKNGAEKGYAHFGVAQRVGTTLEEDGQKGMFKMIEALTVKGTRNFTDSTILQYLKSIDVKPHDVSFSTREDDVTYLIKNIPVANTNTVDSSLLILYNWLNSINIDEEDIRDEAPFVKNALLYEWDASKRLDDKLLNELYPHSCYGMNLREEDILRVENFTSKELRNFYYKWFRPDFQTIMVVGDIDLNLMETKIKSVFSTIQKPLDKQEREYFKPEPFSGAKVFILKDKEYNKTKISIDILK